MATVTIFRLLLPVGTWPEKPGFEKLDYLLVFIRKIASDAKGMSHEFKGKSKVFWVVL